MTTRPIPSIGFWKNSLVRRFFLLSLLVASVPLIVTVLVYDRLTAGLVADMAKERAYQSLTQVQNSMHHFVRQHLHALEAISELPEIPLMFETPDALPEHSQTLSLIYFDIDRPEIYGALFFDADWNLVNALPGQSASGFPYWGKGQFVTSGLPVSRFGDAIFIGPQPATPGLSGWYLTAIPMPASPVDGKVPGYLAFQVRLASLTAYLSYSPLDFGQPSCLNIDTAGCFDVLGRDIGHQTANGISLEMLPGWSLHKASGAEPILAKDQQRVLVLVMAGLVLLLVSTFFYFLVRRVRRRVFPLIDAANAVSEGEWRAPLSTSGNDEITLLARAFNRMTDHLDSLLLARGEAERKAVWGEFATGIAHEIRNPLATIKVCVQALPEGTAEDRELQSLMTGEIDRINLLISSLLEYARPPHPDSKAVSLEKVVSRLSALIAPMAKERGVSLRVETENTVLVRVDENQIQQIVMNLLINALEASASGSDITLKTAMTETGAEITVEDQGCGMDENQIASVTQPFYTTKTTGTGLGLAVSLRLAELNKAHLDFDSEPGKGTRVSLRFNNKIHVEKDDRDEQSAGQEATAVDY